MIPLKLQIKNFLSYGPEVQTIDFEPYQLICFSGKNGHGKSALLDAITWALWGNARKIAGTAKADEGILRLGQTQMMVVLDFICNNQKYRIKREYTKTYGKPLVTLDFGAYQADGSLISLSETKLRETQKKIEQTIRLNLEAFVNSAFLRQGQANEFSKKSPKDRKEIFAQILGLQDYETIKRLALEKAKKAVTQKESLSTYQEKMEIELQKRDTIITQIKKLKKELSNLSEQEKHIFNDQTQIEKSKKKLHQDEQDYNMLKFKQKQLEQYEKKQQNELLETRDQWKSIHKIQIALPDRSQLEEEKKSLIEQINKHQKTLQKKLLLKEQYLKNKEDAQKIEKEFYNTFAKYEQDKKLAIEKLQIALFSEEKIWKELLKKQSEKSDEKKQAEKDIKKLQHTISLSQISKKELETQNKQFERRKEYYQKYITQGNWIKKELTSLKQKKILSQDKGNPSCPLCEQNLSASRKRFLQAKFETQEAFLMHRFSRLSQIIKNLKKKLIEQHTAIDKLKGVFDKNKLHEIRIQELAKKLKSLDHDILAIGKQISEAQKNKKQLGKSLEDANKELKKIEDEGNSRLQKNSTYKKLITQISSNVTEAKTLKYNEQEHEKASQELKAIENKLTEYETMREQIAGQKERKKKVCQLCKSLKQIKKEKYMLDKKIDQYKDVDQRKEAIHEKETCITKKLKELTRQKGQLLHQKGGLENQHLKLKQLAKEVEEQEKVLKALDNEIADYKTIATATGKDGIQALLIENAIPEVEQEANSILSKLTNNQAQIFIESLRDLKKGGTKETLDIKISDAAGIRPYELFSGGEAFRIDFSLRIAISKLLARRAGTALQTLIIDEGFGSQDEEGLVNIMDAIYKIQDDFSKVIIVSHLSALKDQFPVHFFIQKGPNGSHVRIIEQG